METRDEIAMMRTVPLLLLLLLVMMMMMMMACEAARIGPNIMAMTTRRSR